MPGGVAQTEASAAQPKGLRAWCEPSHKKLRHPCEFESEPGEHSPESCADKAPGPRTERDTRRTRLALANNVKKLQGREDEYRLRVGDWRVIFTQDGVILN